MRFRAACLLSSLVFSLSAGQGPKEKDLIRAFDKLVIQYESIGKEIEQIKRLIGRDGRLDGVELLAARSAHSERVRVRLEDAAKAFEDEDYEKAKESLQLAWEAVPDDAVANYNLGLAYYRLGNTPLAKKMFKSALELDKTLPRASLIRTFLEGDNAVAKAETTDIEEKLRTEMINLRKEVDSYIRARDLTMGAKIKASVDVLDKMHTVAKDQPTLQREFFLSMGESYSDFELFPKALELLKEYEAAMEGEVLPDGYHSKLLQIEERNKALNEALSSYIGNQPEKDVRRRLKRNLDELEIFALQMDEFVQELASSDEDFTKLTKRLGEYKWGRRPGRHVMVVDRFSDLLYSNLQGTLPIDRYQDSSGRRFLKEITQLADRLELKDAEFVEVELNVNGTTVPYVVLFTYIPKHQAFIVVRVPREELVG